MGKAWSGGLGLGLHTQILRVHSDGPLILRGCLEWWSLLHPSQKSFGKAPRHFCSSWTSLSVVEEVGQCGEAGCCRSQERECRWC